MPKQNYKRLILVLCLASVFVLIGSIWMVSALNRSGGVEMSQHGWGAMVAGTVLSLVIGGGLSLLLIWSRRNGYDESAHEMHWVTGEEASDDTAS